MTALTKVLGALLLVSTAAACASAPEHEPVEPLMEGIYQFTGEEWRTGTSSDCPSSGCDHATSTTAPSLIGGRLVGTVQLRDDGTIRVTSNSGLCETPRPDNWRWSGVDRVEVRCGGVRLGLTSSGGSGSLVLTREISVRGGCVDYERDAQGRRTSTCATWDYRTVTRAYPARVILAINRID